jgi:Na+-transporting NADH:ubiquinone oxidoreductase subunit E
MTLAMILADADPNSISGLISLAVKAIFVENILLAFFLGMCSYLAVSKRVDTAIGLGLAVIFVETITCPVNWFIWNYVLREDALSWLGLPGTNLQYLQLIFFIGVIAAMVQIVEMAIDKFSQKLYTALGIFLPLIAVNCAILGASLFMAERDYTLAQATVFGFGSGIGWALAIISMAAIRMKLRTANVPNSLRGLGITFIVTGLIATAFMTFSGIKV